MDRRLLAVVVSLYALSFYAALVLVDTWAMMLFWGSALGLSLWGASNGQD